jgi:hypothetical protein
LVLARDGRTKSVVKKFLSVDTKNTHIFDVVHK